MSFSIFLHSLEHGGFVEEQQNIEFTCEGDKIYCAVPQAENLIMDKAKVRTQKSSHTASVNLSGKLLSAKGTDENEALYSLREKVRSWLWSQVQ
jgi:hypothetical protein